MNKKSLLMVMVVVGISVFFIAGGIIAGTTVDDVIKMENKAYDKHTKSIVEFTHKKHVEDYKITCGECHHDDKGQPLADLKEGDDVQNCIECHKIPGEKPKGKDAPKLTKQEELQYHAEAIHANCRDCHR
ncbi:MAG: cytochrome c family protein, partial [Desulfobacterales bacterium]|nr:cytochrome c family protein [Desulfobacterales bacterium]